VIDLAGRTVLVIGGLGGIGRAVVDSCREAGAAVLLADLPGAALDAWPGPSCGVDLADVDEACTRLAAFAATHGPLDGLVNAAGVSQSSCFPDIPTADWRRIVDIDLVGPAQVVQALVPHLRAPGASVVNVTSIEGDGVYASRGLTSPSYAAAKAGLKLATKCLAVELGREGIRVNAVAPGFVDTPMTTAAMAGSGEWIAEQTALGRAGRPDDLGPPVAFLLSDAARYITAHTLVVDGGMGLGAIRRDAAS
jgi:NAD(P)-dependent dehydrogenase (short-subunit alcohol dehydrogenase family)